MADGSTASLPADRRLPRRRLARPQASSSSGPLIGRVQWTPAYVCLLVYVFVILTYRLPIGNVAMAVAIVAIFFQRERFRFPPAISFFGLFLLWAAVGYTQTSYPPFVWERLIQFGKLWLIMLVAFNAIRTREQLRFFMIFFLFWFATHPARGSLFNYFVYEGTVFGRTRWINLYANPNEMAALTIFPLALGAVLLYDRHRWVRIGATASLFVLPCIILLTQSRGAFLGLAMFGALTLLGERKKVRAFVMVLLLIGTGVLVAPESVWERIRGIPTASDTDSSGRQRRLIWEVAGKIIAEHPVGGVGLGAYPQAHSRYAVTRVEWSFARGFRDTHSTYLNILAETGYPGLLIFMALLGSVFTLSRRARRRLKPLDPLRANQIWYLEASLVGYLTAAVFMTVSQLSFLYLHMVILVVFCEISLRESSAGAPRTSRERSARRQRGAAGWRSAGGIPRDASIKQALPPLPRGNDGPFPHRAL